MAATNTNDAFLSVGGTDVSGLWTELKLSMKRGTADANYGSGIEWEGKLAALKGYSGDLTIIYEETGVPATVQAMNNNDSVAIIYGPQGNSSGEPKHDQDFVVTGIEWSQMADKSNMLVYKIKLESNGTPRSDWLSGDTFSA